MHQVLVHFGRYLTKHQISKFLQYNTGSNMLDIKQFLSDLIDSYLDILTFDEKLLVFKEIKIIFTRYDFDLLFPVGVSLQ
jgi:hypothetical protein